MKQKQATLKVRAVGSALVQDYQAMAGKPSVRRYIGRRWDAIAREFVLTNAVVEVPDTKEYRHEVRLGTLEAADEATAIACGSPAFYHFV